MRGLPDHHTDLYLPRYTKLQQQPPEPYPGLYGKKRSGGTSQIGVTDIDAQLTILVRLAPPHYDGRQQALAAALLRARKRAVSIRNHCMDVGPDARRDMLTFAADVAQGMVDDAELAEALGD